MGTSRLLLLPLIVGSLTSYQASATEARVLPKGRFRVGVIYGVTEAVKDNFTDDGKRISATNKYDIELSTRNLGGFDERIKELVQVLNQTDVRYNPGDPSTAPFFGMTRNSGGEKLGDALSRGNLDVEGSANIQQTVVNAQYGITEKLSFGIYVPIVTHKVSFSPSIWGSNSAADIYKFMTLEGEGQAGQASLGNDLGGLSQVLQDISGLGTGDIEATLQSRGYTRTGSFEATGVGDVNIGFRYMYFDNDQWIDAFQLAAAAPTGKLADASDLIALDRGEGVWDLSLSHRMNYLPVWAPRLMLRNMITYAHRLPGERNIRVRKSSTDLFPDASSEEVLRVDKGNKLTLTNEVDYEPFNHMWLFSRYEWTWKNRDRYQGSQLGVDYSYLSYRTDTYLETLVAGLLLDGAMAFLKNDFPIPAQLQLAYYYPVSGRNTPVTPYGTLELYMYF